MQGKGLIKFFTYVLLAVVIYQFLLVLPIKSIESDADDYAQMAAAKYKDNPEVAQIEADKARQAYLDSVSTEPINLFVATYTYQELKKQQLAFGLDLQGGMSVVLQVDIPDLITFLSGDNPDPAFAKALQKAKEEQIKQPGADYVSLFGQAFAQEASGRELASIFLISDRLAGVSLEMKDAQVLDVLREKVGESVKITYERLKQRIDKFGVAQPVVSLDEQTNRITVELPGITNPTRAREYLQATAELEFWELYVNTDVLDGLVRLDERLKKEKEGDKASTETPETPEEDSLAKANDSLAVANTDLEENKAGPLFSLLSPLNDGSASIGFARAGDTIAVNGFLSGEGQRFLPKNARFVWTAKHFSTDAGERLFTLYAVNTKGRKESPLQGERVTSANKTDNSMGRGYAVSLDMDAEGAREWKSMTERNIGKQVAIVLDNKVYSAPRVNGVIPNGSTQITGDFTAADAGDLANILSVGKLPARTQIIEEAIVGPTLGEATVAAGFLALAAGLLLVILFMLGYYGASGAVSLVTLILNLVFIVGSLASFGTVLTLAGMAGIVLTIGMAVDANVIIFDRVREELRKGATWAEAVKDGFGHSYSAIIDANITTLATAIVLFYYGLGPIKGFATVLIIGVICSVFTAVLVGRVIFDYFIEKDKPLSVGGKAAMNFLAEPKYDVLGKRKIAYLFSTVVILAGIGSMFTRGFELGVDLSGGRSYTVQFTQAVDIEAFKPKLAEAFEGYERSIVKTFNESNQIKVTTSYLQESPADDVDEQVVRKVYEAAKAYAGTSAGDISFEDFRKGKPGEEVSSGVYLNASNKIGPTIADDIRNSAWKTSLIALGFIFFYIFVRFRRWQYSAGAVVALTHDVLFILSLFSLLHGVLPISLEIDQSFIAALLTIIGYSINDTMIVFDRIREETRNVEEEKASFASLVNQAINATLSRTAITSMTTLFVVLILFIFGGDGIRGFSFALLLGILVGTYSSVFIAAPILADTVKDIDSIREEEEVITDLPGLNTADDGQEVDALDTEEGDKKA